MSHYLVAVLVPHDERDDLTAARAAMDPYNNYDNAGNLRPWDDVICDYNQPCTYEGLGSVAPAGQWLADNPDFDAAGLVVEGLGMWKYERHGHDDDHPDGYVSNALRDAVNDGRADWRIVFMDCHL